jgi:hypothetical protein
MTRDEARQRIAELNREGGAHWIARQVSPGDWRPAKVSAPGLGPAQPDGTRTEQRPRPDHADDPRPAPFRNIPPYGGGV